MQDDEIQFGSQEEVKRAADLREWLEGRINELEAEVSRLREMLLLVDSVLRKSSFVPAAELRNAQSAKQREADLKAPTQRQQPRPAKTSETFTPSGQTQEASPAEAEIRPLRRTKDGMLIANAYVDPSKVVIVPAGEVKVQASIPPFQSFFINRILKGYEKKDQELGLGGKIAKEHILAFTVEESEGNISKISVSNYRDRARLNEILSTVSWAFSRMLEKK